MSEGLDRAALEAAVAKLSPLSLQQVEKMFGGEVTAANKAAVWRFLNMSHNQQRSLWDVHVRIRMIAPDVKIEKVA